jgi:CheY-like chemotaxis protein
VACAVEAASAAEFDLLISDLGLPDGRGIDLIERLGDTFRGRAIALTGYGMPSDTEATRAAGFAEHLIKPLVFDTLLSAIRRVAATSVKSS